MKILLFYHSLISDWNHGNAHFLRGIASELLSRGHQVRVFEPEDGWSYRNWVKEKGENGIKEFKSIYPQLQPNFYGDLHDFKDELKDADLVIVHEWNDPELVSQLGRLKQQHDYVLLFHDTHHRSATSPGEIEQYDLAYYDGVLAFGKIIRDLYLENNWIEKAWTWHEAADVNVFHPKKRTQKQGDLVWIGNWGDNERTEELIEFLIKPVQRLGLNAKMYGVRYPERALKLLDKAGIAYGGYLSSHRVPEVYSSYTCTVHVPRRAYAESLPGIPTIRPFEAMACGIALISAPWQDTENLFRKNRDFLMVEDGKQMTGALKDLTQHPEKARDLAEHGLTTIRNRHTCAHRVDQLMDIYRSLVKSEENISHNKTI